MEQGGATVFPDIEKAVFPQKGTAIMWYNLKDDGEGNTKTLHAACPVIVGSKWGKYPLNINRIEYIIHYYLPQFATSGFGSVYSFLADPAPRNETLSDSQ